jgi:hypothetical protein
VCLSAETGAAVAAAGGETDLLCLDPGDLPRLQEARSLWMGDDDGVPPMIAAGG